VKKSTFLLFVSGLLSLAATFRIAEWGSYVVDEQLTVQLPVAPQLLTPAVQRIAGPQPIHYPHLWVAQDAAGTYQVASRPVPDPEADYTTTAARRVYYDEVIDELLEQQGAILLSQTKFSTAGGDGLEVKYTAPRPGSSRQAVQYLRTLVVAKTGYLLSFASTDAQDSTGTSGSEQRQRFFRAIVVKPAN